MSIRRLFLWGIIPVGISFILVTIVVQILTSTPCPSEWTLERCFAFHVLGYFKNWGLALGAFATALLALVALWNILDERTRWATTSKEKSLDRVLDWVEDAMHTISFLKTDEEVLPSLKKLPDELGKLNIKSMKIGTDVTKIGGDIEVKLVKAVVSMGALAQKLDDTDIKSISEKDMESIFSELEKLADMLGNIVKSIYRLKI